MPVRRHHSLHRRRAGVTALIILAVTGILAPWPAASGDHGRRLVAFAAQQFGLRLGARS